MYRRIQERNCMLVVQRLKGVRRNNERGFVPYVAKMNTGATYKDFRDDIFNKRFRCINAEIIIRRGVCFKNKDQSQKIGIYVITYKEKWVRINKESEREINLG
jgi:hypothetical protein